MTVITNLSQLPDLSGEAEIILDFETSSGHEKKVSTNPWHNCRIAGTGITTPKLAEQGIGFYLPTGHTSDNSRDGLKNRVEGQLQENCVAKWLYDSLRSCTNLIGHNIKYDMHVLANNWDKYQPFAKMLVNTPVTDTLSHAKMTDSDRWGYGLKKLSIDWLGKPDHSDPLQPYLKHSNGNYFNKDYGQIPVEVCGPYCVGDLLTTWEVETYCREKMDSRSNSIWEIEKKITSLLFKIERTGFRIDLQRLGIMDLGAQQMLIRLQEDIHTLLVAEGCSSTYIRPNSNKDCFDVICSHYGLPVLAWTEGSKKKKSDPSFDKHALKAYLHHPVVMENERLVKIVEMIMDYRKWDKIVTSFFTPYKTLHIDGLLHGDFNQIIRTGRMAMRTPNLQQCPLEVRILMVPYDQDIPFRKQYEALPGKIGVTAGGAVSDEVITARDASQIEFRLIVNYCRNSKALRSYQNDPGTDYHQMMADMCAIDRKPAKNINFMLSYGGGKYKCLSMLKDALDLLGIYGEQEKLRFEGRNLHVPAVEYKGKVIQKEMNLSGFEAFCWTRASAVYNTYHKQLPELRKITWKAQELIQERGYVLNLYGRVRKLPVWQSRKAFNSIIQSSASDIIKERTVAFCEYLDSEGKLWDSCGDHQGKIKLVNLVHDELNTSEPRELHQDKKLQSGIMELLCNPEQMVAKMDVPILWDSKSSDICWAQTK